MDDKDDHDLVDGLKANDPIYQKLLVDRYVKQLLSIVMSLGFSREDSLEVVNDGIYKVVKYINKFDLTRSSKFTAWIVRITINTARDKYKQLKNSPVSQSTDERAERGIQDMEVLWHDQQPTDSELGQLSQKTMEQALKNLSETDQDILRCCACGLQHKEIAVLLNKTPGAVKVAHLRAKKRLKHKYISILEAFQDRRKAMALKDFLGIEVVNEETKN